MQHRFLISLFLLAAGTSVAEPMRGATTWTGKVVGVHDGDTLTVMREGRAVKVRLHGVDCPELAQPFGQRAKQLTAQLVFGQVVQVEVKATDRYGRLVARVSTIGHSHRSPRDRSLPHRVVPLHRSLEEALVRAGLAWWYKQYSPRDTELARLETEARQARRGLWADAAPTAPWDWRRRRSPAPKQNCYQACMKESAMRAVAIQAIEADCRARCASRPVSGGGESPQAAAASAATVQPASHRGNVQSRVFHAAGCKHFRCKHCTAAFSSAAAARQAGFRPHPACVGGREAPRCSSPPDPPCPGDDACRQDQDCAAVAREVCACPPCYPNSVWGVSRDAAERWRRHRTRHPKKCVDRRCAKCPRRLEPFCARGRCAVRELRL